MKNIKRLKPETISNLFSKTVFTIGEESIVISPMSLRQWIDLIAKINNLSDKFTSAGVSWENYESKENIVKLVNIIVNDFPEVLIEEGYLPIPVIHISATDEVLSNLIYQNSVCIRISFEDQEAFDINDEIDKIDKTPNVNDQLYEVTKFVDQQIYNDYYLFKNNYIAYDFQEQTNEFQSHYSEQDKTNFLNYLKEKATVEDVSEEKMMCYLLQIYANPVRTKYGKQIIENKILES
jgi:hypothetical protein